MSALSSPNIRLRVLPRIPPTPNELSIGSVTIGTGPTDGAVSITGDAPAQVLDFKLPPGPPGPTLVFRGAWSSGTDYAVFDSVTENGSSYACQVANTSSDFDADLISGYWLLIAAKGDQGDSDVAAGYAAAAAADVVLTHADVVLTHADVVLTHADVVSAAASAAGAAAAVTAAIDTDSTLAANSDAKIASQKATKTYIDARVSPPVATRTALNALSTALYSTAYLTEAGREGAFKWSGSDLSGVLVGSGIASSAVDASTETITHTAHGLVTGDAVIVTAAVDGLSANTIYYAIKVDADNVRLATTVANADAGTAVNLTGTTALTLKKHFDPSQLSYVTPAADITGASGAWVRVNASQVKNIYGLGTPTTATYRAAAAQGGVWNIPPGTPAPGVAPAAGSNATYWQGGDYGAAVLPGVQDEWFSGYKFFRETTALPNTYATVRIDRTANYTGGSSSNVAVALKVNHFVSAAGVADLQWAICASMDNSATAGQNVGVYGQGLRRDGAGRTWGLCAETRDYYASGDIPAVNGGTIGTESGVFGNGPDTNLMRIGVLIPIAKNDPAGLDVVGGRAIYIGTGLLSSGASWANGVYMDGNVLSGIKLAATGTVGLVYTAASILTTGIDLSLATISGAAVRLGSNKYLSFHNSDAIQARYNSSTGNLEFTNGGSISFAFKVNTGGELSMNGTKILGLQATGWTAGTGTPSKGAFAAYAGQTHTGSYVQATIQALDDAVKAVSQRLLALDQMAATHGLKNA